MITIGIHVARTADTNGSVLAPVRANSASKRPRSIESATSMDILQDAGFRTFEASDGDKAMTLLAREHAVTVLLFTDVQMPGTRNGFAVASGHVRPEPGEMPVGARFIGKPFTADMVHDHLQDILPDGRKPTPLRCREQARSAS